MKQKNQEKKVKTKLNSLKHCFYTSSYVLSRSVNDILSFKRISSSPFHHLLIKFIFIDLIDSEEEMWKEQSKQSPSHFSSSPINFYLSKTLFSASILRGQ